MKVWLNSRYNHIIWVMKNCHWAFTLNSNDGEACAMCIHNIYNNHYSAHVFSDYLPPCLISLNNPDPRVHVNIISWSVRRVYPLVQLRRRPATYLDPIFSEDRAFHPYDTSASLWGDGWWQHVRPRSCFPLSKLRKENAPRAWIAILSAPTAAASSAYRRHLVWPRSLPKASSDVRQNAFPVSV